MDIILAKTAGFCFGVDRAVNIVYDLCNKDNKVATLGPIIHNPQVVDDLKSKNVNILSNVYECVYDEILVIRSHGVPKQIYQDIKSKNIKYIDATCPFVSKIHRIVEKNIENIDLIIIIGDPIHPEVIGIVGHCSIKSKVIKDDIDLDNFILTNHKHLENDNILLVSQTTFNVAILNKYIDKLTKHFKHLKVFNTICNATNERQSEAAEIAKQVNCMIVIGGKNSSNTIKLKDVCEQYCKTLLIETYNDLKLNLLKGYEKVGVTAGASTPSYIIKEVLKYMSQINNEENFAELFEQSMNESLYVGKKIKGIITSILPNELHVDIGAKHSGFVPISEITDDPNIKIEDICKKGDEISLMVLKINDHEGFVTLSKKKCDFDQYFEILEKAYNDQTVVSGIIIDVVKSGVIALTNNVRVFIPASQVSNRRIDDLSTLLKQQVDFKIIEVKRKNRRIIGSIRLYLKELQKINEEKIWQEIEKDKHYTGKVKSIMSYGAFVDIGGVDGMLHISELSWRKLKHPSEVIKIDDIIQVFIKSFDKDKRKVSLGYKKTEDNPWEIFKKDYKKDEIVEAKIVSLTDFGAFAEIIPGVDGLIHISQIDTKHINKVESVLQINQHVKAKIIDLDVDKKRISLSIKEANVDQHDQQNNLPDNQDV